MVRADDPRRLPGLDSPHLCAHQPLWHIRTGYAATSASGGGVKPFQSIGLQQIFSASDSFDLNGPNPGFPLPAITTPANLQPARAFLEQSPYPFSAPKPRLLVRDHHLAKMLRRGEIFIRCCGLLEGKHAINHRSKLVMLNGTIHLLKGGTTRNIDALQAQSRQDRSQWGCRGSKARQNTNERDLTTKGTGADRFLQGP